MTWIKNNLSLALGIAFPLLMLCVMVVWINVPALGRTPKHDFIYITGPRLYRVEGTKIVQSQSRSGRRAEVYPPLYVYDVSTQQSREISFEEAEKLSLLRVASDGFSIVPGTFTKGYLPLFRDSETDYTKRFLKRGNSIIPLNLDFTSDAFDNFSLIGWIE